MDSRIVHFLAKSAQGLVFHGKTRMTSDATRKVSKSLPFVATAMDFKNGKEFVMYLGEFKKPKAPAVAPLKLKSVRLK